MAKNQAFKILNSSRILKREGNVIFANFEEDKVAVEYQCPYCMAIFPEKVNLRNLPPVVTCTNCYSIFQ